MRELRIRIPGHAAKLKVVLIFCYFSRTDLYVALRFLEKYNLDLKMGEKAATGQQQATIRDVMEKKPEKDPRIKENLNGTIVYFWKGKGKYSETMQWIDRQWIIVPILQL